MFVQTQITPNPDSIKFLPTSRIFKEKATGHYLSMIDLEDLLDIMTKYPDYKKSPTIQGIFNYKSFKLMDADKITFKYNDLKCDDLVSKEKRNLNLKKLFLNILNCNTTESLKDIIQKAGANEDNAVDKELEKERKELQEKIKKRNEEMKEKMNDEIQEIEDDQNIDEDKKEENIRKLNEKYDDKKREYEKQDYEMEKRIDYNPF